MQEKVRKVFNISLIVITLLVIFLSDCTHNNNSTITTHSDTVLVYKDTGSHTISIVPQLIYSKPTIEWKDNPVDTMAILQDYFTLNYYVDTIVNDSELVIVNRNLVYKNKLDSSFTEYKNKRVTQMIVNTTTTILIQNQKELFINAELGVSANVNNVWLGLSYKNKKLLYNASYDLLNKGVKVGIGYKLF